MCLRSDWVKENCFVCHHQTPGGSICGGHVGILFYVVHSSGYCYHTSRCPDKTRYTMPSVLVCLGVILCPAVAINIWIYF